MSSENYGWGEGKNSEQEISEKIQDLEKELTTLRKRQEEIIVGMNSSSSSRWNSVFFLIITLTLILIPSILVFLGEWINIPEIRNYPRDFLCRYEFLCIDGLPGFFFWIIVFLLISTLIIFVYGDVFSPFIHTLSNSSKNNDKRIKFKVNRLFIFTTILLFFEIFINQRIERVPGAELLIIAFIFFYYFLKLEDVSVWQKVNIYKNRFMDYLKRNYLQMATILVSLIYVFLIIGDSINNFGNIKWIYFILAMPIICLVIIQRKKLPFLFWITVLLIIIYSFQLNNWLYSKIGDEYAFYYFARDLSNRTFLWKLAHLFSLEGVYSTHSVLSSIITNYLMKIFGFNHYGWIFSNYSIIITTIIIFYFFFERFFNKKIALITTILLSFSSYLIGFSRIGYNNIQALLFISITMFISGELIRYKKPSCAFLLGLSSGLLIYTFQAAYFYLPIVLLLFFLFIFPRNKFNLNLYLITFFGFLIITIPIFFQPDFTNILHQGTFFNKSYLVESSESIFVHLKSNLIFSLFSYLYLFKESHYVVLSMIDPITAIFFFIGLVISIRNMFRERKLLFIVLAYFILLFSIGIIHDYPAPPITRMFILLPIIFCLAALGIYFICKLLANNILSQKWVTLIGTVILIAIIFVNVFQSSAMVQEKYEYYYFEPVVFKVLQFNTENLYNSSKIPEGYLILTSENYDLNWMYMLQDVYKIPESKSQFYRIIYEVEGINDEWQNRLNNDENLIVFAPTTFSEETFSNLSQIMLDNGKTLCQLRYRKDAPVLAYMWTSPQNQYICEELFDF